MCKAQCARRVTARQMLLDLVTGWRDNSTQRNSTQCNAMVSPIDQCQCKTGRSITIPNLIPATRVLPILHSSLNEITNMPTPPSAPNPPPLYYHRPVHHSTARFNLQTDPIQLPRRLTPFIQMVTAKGSSYRFSSVSVNSDLASSCT